MINEVGRDLRLEPELQGTIAAPIHSALASKTKAATPINEARNGVPQERAKHTSRVGTGALLAILAVLTVVSVVDPQQFLSLAQKQLELSKHNLEQWVAVATRQPAVTETITADVITQQQPLPQPGRTETTAREHSILEKPSPNVEQPVKTHSRILIQQGSTIQKIARQFYGANTLLGMDLMKEFNPQIANLNWVFPGQHLVLPPLTQDIMLRKQPDDSYGLVAGSFPSARAAEKYARLLASEGYQVTITPNRVSDDLLLHRVEIEGLRNREEANQTWEAGLKKGWFSFGGDPKTVDEIY